MQYIPVKGANYYIFTQACLNCSYVNVVEQQYIYSYTTKYKLCICDFFLIFVLHDYIQKIYQYSKGSNIQTLNVMFPQPSKSVLEN